MSITANIVAIWCLDGDRVVKKVIVRENTPRNDIALMIYFQKN
jgi:hypothetical protein